MGLYILFTISALFHKHIFLKASEMNSFKRRVRLILSVDVLKISFWLRLQFSESLYL